MTTSGIPFDRIAEDYDRTRGGLERGRYNADLLAPWLDGTGTVVEIGVGTGLVAAALAERGLSPVGVDLSLPMLAHAHTRLPGRVVAGDALRLPLRSGAATSAYLVHVLHLVPDTAAAMAEARRILTDGGRLCVICVGDRVSDCDVTEIVRGLHLGLNGPRSDQPDRVVAAAAAAGFTELNRADASLPVRASPTEVADGLERRMWAWTWDIDDATWQQHAVPVLEQLRALPDPGRRRDTLDARSLLVFSA